eukprot:scaffold1504_cov153-Pinguiococcus_pyrenoidosus.AAC.1
MARRWRRGGEVSVRLRALSASPGPARRKMRSIESVRSAACALLASESLGGLAFSAASKRHS